MTIADYDAVHELWFSSPNMGFNDRDDSREGIARFLARNPGLSFVAISTATGEHAREPAARAEIAGVIMAGHDGRRGYIYHTAVRESERHKGIGKALVQACLSALKAEGISKVALLVFAKNEAGNAFWEKQGFSLREDVCYRNKALYELTRIDT